MYHCLCGKCEMKSENYSEGRMIAVVWGSDWYKLWGYELLHFEMVFQTTHPPRTFLFYRQINWSQ